MRVALIGDSLTEGRPGVSFSNLLQEKYPDITFTNLGKSGETVKSLHSRLIKEPLATDYDFAFLWIGVNDVYSKLLKVQAKPVVKDHEEFRTYFTKVVELILSSSKQIIIVSPAIVGENMLNEPNQELKDLSAIMQSASLKYQNFCFLNLQSVFEQQLSNVTSSDYIGTSILSVMKDVLFYKKASRINQLSKKRGLHLTLDGIHFNSKGAKIVADEYATKIDQLLFTNNSELTS
ncbi:SGNH/GDSL hydrolase family protein [Lysinibacillus sp. NPDC093712]|uniref:SGNH/GDSL hydrolase family protein n=1 Tax=Lysinibacillus sp. NPDC093712 TaxID=3390579 RepID=UPI003D021B2B